jgi:hypothetical protein
LGEQVVLQLYPQVLEGRLSRLQGEARVQRFLFQLGVTQFEDHGVRLYYGARPQHDSLDAPFSGSRQPSRVLRDERSEASDLANEGSPLHHVEE